MGVLDRSISRDDQWDRLARRPEPTTQLKPAEGHGAALEAVKANCATRHSVDHIAMKPPGKGKAFWDSEVTEMIKVRHTPIDRSEDEAIGAYLRDAY